MLAASSVVGWAGAIPRSRTACSSTLIPSSYLPLSSKTCPSATVALAIAGSPGRRCRLLIASPQPLRFLVVRLVDPQAAERHQALRYVGGVGSEECAASVEGAAEQRIRPVELAEFLVDASQRLVQLGLHRGLSFEALRVPHTAVDDRPDAQL